MFWKDVNLVYDLLELGLEFAQKPSEFPDDGLIFLIKFLIIILKSARIFM